MSRALFPAVFLLAFVTVSAHCEEGTETTSIRLTLPPTGYAVVGAEMNVHFDNIVLSEHPEDLSFVVTSDLGTTKTNRWTVTPTEAQAGRHSWQIEVLKAGKSLAKKSMTWQVSAAKVKSPKDASLLIVGDSLTSATLYPNELSKRLGESGLSKSTFLGTHVPGNASPGVAHEGYGGWTWHRFVTHYSPDSDALGTKRISPFVFLEGDRPKLDVPRYVRESLMGANPDFVVFFLGINDCFGADPSSVSKTDRRIDEMFHYADLLVRDFRAAVPKARIGICLTPPGNFRQSSFQIDYKDAYTRWGWKRIQHRVVERQLEKHGAEQTALAPLDIVPIELNLDPVDGFPDNNSVHPNAVGYTQIAASIHAWMMSRLTADE
jgi:lysophospholipase L1-like esterase